jgi:hypothetical protein
MIAARTKTTTHVSGRSLKSLRSAGEGNDVDSISSCARR